MIDTSFYNTGRGLESGLRMGQQLGAIYDKKQDEQILQEAMARVQGGEPIEAVAQAVMGQSPAVAQQLLGLKQSQLEQQSAQQGIQRNEQMIKIGDQEFSMLQVKQSAMPMFGALMTDNEEARARLIDEAAAPFSKTNPEVADTIKQIKDLAPEQQANALSGIIKTLQQAGVYPQDPSQLMGQGTALSQNLSLYDQAIAAGDTDRAELIKRNIDPYSRNFSGGLGTGQAKQMTEQGLNPILAEREQMKTIAGERGKQQADSEANAKKNSKAFGTYQAAIGQLEKAASQTTTNPVAGLLPAVTANAQIMEGSISMMAPVLKEMFRQAGEGTFTDKDQELLLQMVPSRSEHPEAIKAKLEMIDNLVRAKLQQGAPVSQGTTKPRNFESQYMGGGQ